MTLYTETRRRYTELSHFHQFEANVQSNPLKSDQSIQISNLVQDQDRRFEIKA